jgi:hypothetical protein
MFIIGVTGDKLFTGVNGFSVIASVVDTTDIFITDDNDTRNKFMASVVVRVCQVSMGCAFLWWFQ